MLKDKDYAKKANKERENMMKREGARESMVRNN